MRILRIALISLLFLLGYSKTTAPSCVDNILSEYKTTQALNTLELRRYDSEILKFVKQLGFDESSNNWLSINTYGAFTEYQFTNRTLKFLGYGHITLAKFKKDPTIFPPELQKQVLLELMTINSMIMDNYIKDYQGLEIRGIKITKAGILAACHLGGPSSVKLYLITNGNINRKDAYGTSIETYLKRYQIFDLNLRLI